MKRRSTPRVAGALLLVSVALLHANCSSSGESSGGGSGDAGQGGDVGTAGDGAAATGEAGAVEGGSGGTPDVGGSAGASGATGGTDVGGSAGADTGSGGDSAGAGGSVPPACRGTPSCGVARDAAACTAIRGCGWSQCEQRVPGVTGGCGSEGRDDSGACPPGCMFNAPSGNCVGPTGEYYAADAPCIDASRQTQSTCVGVGGVWTSCVWNASVLCHGRPVRTVCDTLMSEATCVREGCVWE